MKKIESNTKLASWRQFRLSTLLVVVFAICVVVGLYFRFIYSTNRLVAWIEANGGIVSFFHEKFDDSSLVRNFGLSTGEPANELRFYKKVRTVDFASCKQVKDIAPLGSLVDLKRLNLSQTDIRDFSVLSKMTTLQELNLSGTSFHELEVLAGLEDLRELNLSDTKITNVTQLTQLKNLEILRLDNTLVSDFRPLSKLRLLQELSICGTKLRNEDSLKGLDVKSLFMDDTYFGDWQPLQHLTSLKTLTLRNSSINIESLVLLREALPNCSVIGFPAKQKRNQEPINDLTR